MAKKKKKFLEDDEALKADEWEDPPTAEAPSGDEAKAEAPPPKPKKEKSLTRIPGKQRKFQ